MLQYISELTDRVLKGSEISPEEATGLLEIAEQKDIVTLISFANILREEFKGSLIDTCAIMNAKSGRCSEDCKFCSQSVHYATDIEKYPMAGDEEIIKNAKEAKNFGANRFSLVTSGRDVKNEREFEAICSAVENLSSQVEIEICASLGTLTKDAAKSLEKSGVGRYHHNLETAESFFPEVCTTHSYKDRVNTVEIAKEAGLSVCCGGIFGLGESRKQRLELAFTLKELDVDSIPLNFLNPIPGTPLANAEPLHPMEIYKTLSVFRFIHPQKDIRICGGRQRNLRNTQALMYLSGVNAVMIGNYLTGELNDPLLRQSIIVSFKSGN